MAERRIQMMKNMGVLVCLLGLCFALFGSCVEGKYVVEKSRLRVTLPNKLKGVYGCAMGNFGVPRYGGTMAGSLVYPKANSKACQSFHDFAISFKSKQQQLGGLPTFVLADRGGCEFAWKAWNAQNAGAAAILVVDDKFEQLITMDSPSAVTDDYLNNITIPAALISKSFGDRIKKALSSGSDMVVNVNLDWREALPHPDNRVEYEFWIDSNDECGPMCDSQMEFVNKFKGAAQIMEQKGYTQFTPHYITWSCPEGFVSSQECKSQCINHGRYCAPDPEHDSKRGYDGKDVVVQNLRQACFFKVANESGKPWLWWDYVTNFVLRCPMKENKYTAECSNQVIQSLGMDIKKIKQCVGDIGADVENPILKAEQEAQIGKGSRGDVTVLPTLVINNRQYRGKLDKGAVLKAICAGFEESTEPPICLGEASGALSKQVSSTIGWGVIGAIILGVAAATGIIGYVVYNYKYKLRRHMESEIREILAHYMPLDKEGGFPNQIDIYLGKTDKFDELMAAAAEEKESGDVEEQN